MSLCADDTPTPVIEPDKENAKLIKVTFVVSALALLGGCIAVPASPGYYAPVPAYYAPPLYYGPSIGIGIYAGGRGYGRSHGYR